MLKAGTFPVPDLVFAYTTERGHSAVPLPDYTYWGLPYINLPPWQQWLEQTAAGRAARLSSKKRGVPWEGGLSAKRNQMIWVGSLTNPLRKAFARCAPAAFGERLVHRLPDSKAMHELAWKCEPMAEGQPCPARPVNWTTLDEQCEYRYILHMPGASDWLDHFKHQLSCGSVNIFLGGRPKQLREVVGGVGGGANLSAPTAFKHFDMSGPLLKEGEHFIYVPSSPAEDGSTVCDRLAAALADLESDPKRLGCIARRGRALTRALTMDRVYEYTAAVLRAAARAQENGTARRVARVERSRRVTINNFFGFVPPEKRPWMEHLFVPWHRKSFERGNGTFLMPPFGDETVDGLFQ